MINKDLIKHIDEAIFPLYEYNDNAHKLDHALYVIRRSLIFAKEVGADLNMAYTVAAYHDCAYSQNKATHEVLSAIVLEEDNELKKFFSSPEIKTMTDAVLDHRASSKKEPRNIYGKIVSSADRITDFDILLYRMIEYRLHYKPSLNTDEVIEDIINHANNKFGKFGYAVKKIYFKDDEYENLLETIQALILNKEKFRSIIRNKLENKNIKLK